MAGLRRWTTRGPISEREGRMTAAPLARRAATVSAGALALCLLSAGAAAADTLPLPIPTLTPTDLVGTVTNTVNQVTTKATSSPTPTTTSVPNPVTGSGGSTTTGTTAGSTTSGVTTAGGRTRTGSPSAHVTSPTGASGAAAAAAAAFPVHSWAMMPGPSSEFALPPTSAMPTDPGLAPNVAAPLLLPQSTQHYSQAAQMELADKHTGFPIRSLLLALAVAAAAGVAFEHVRLARGGMPLWAAVPA